MVLLKLQYKMTILTGQKNLKDKKSCQKIFKKQSGKDTDSKYCSFSN